MSVGKAGAATPLPPRRSPVAWFRDLWTSLVGAPPALLPHPDSYEARPSDSLATGPSDGGRNAPAAPADTDCGNPSRGDRAVRRNPAARIVAAFDSAHPVQERERLHGRDDMLDMLFEAVLFNRQHAIVYGARGSGKTSLARIFGDYADQQGAIVIYTACESTSSFAELLRPYLSFIPSSCIPFASQASFEAERQKLPDEFGPRIAVDLLSRLDPDVQVILILDEFDRVDDEKVHAQVATLMKLLSDARLPIQLLIVGIAGTLDDLIGSHPSLRRHLLPISIGRISPNDTRTLIETGAQRAGVTFDEGSIQEIARISCGSPYHVQLFCYVAAVEAVRQDRDTIDFELARRGAVRAFDTWATLNPNDAALFRALADASPDQLEAVQAAAREAAGHDTVSAEGVGVGLLAPALRPDGRSGRLCFIDSAAPQFLLAIAPPRERLVVGVERSPLASRDRAA
ncbi:ATP-binding protein [Sphingomonas bacterium]|uniref:ATP-binding protein n=1 Tax=Sphingomonas bacterium TaxID=1895847 RepID=UPI001576E775|nr:ATP-binding protein [Sphingomonas bacterium]